MKIKKIKTIKFRLTKLHLIKSRSYKSNNKNYTISPDKLESYLKKNLNVLYNFHKNNKKIIFKGVPVNLQKKFSHILAKTKHLFITEKIWIKGLLTNKNSLLKSIKKQKTFSHLNNINDITNILTLKSKPDLIVIFNEEKELPAITESYKLKIPIITINSNITIKQTKLLYKLPGKFEFLNKNNNNVFFLLLLAIFKKLQKI